MDWEHSYVRFRTFTEVFCFAVFSEKILFSTMYLY
jgi:hypothetical protein